MINTLNKIDIIVYSKNHGVDFTEISDNNLKEEVALNLLKLKDIKPKFTSEDYKKFPFYKSELLKQDLFEWQEELDEKVINFLEIMLKNFYSYNQYNYKKVSLYNEDINFKLLNKENLKYLVRFTEENHFKVTYKDTNYSAIYNLLKMNISKNDLIRKIRRLMDYSGNFSFLSTLTSEEYDSIEKLDIFKIKTAAELKHTIRCYNNPEFKGLKELINYITYKKYLSYDINDITLIDFNDLEQKLNIIKELENYIPHDNLGTLIVILINDYNFKITFLNKLLYNVKSLNSEELVKFNEDDEQFALIDALLDFKFKPLLNRVQNENWYTSSNLSQLLTYCIKNKKQAFIKLMNDEKIYNDILKGKNLLNMDTFQSLINLNSLNANNIKDLESIEAKYEYKQKMSISDRLNCMKIKYNTLTFNEFIELIEIADSEYLMQVYNYLSLKVDDKIKAIKEIKNIPNVKSVVQKYENYIRFAQLINEKSFSKRVLDYKYINNLCKEDVLNIMLNYDILRNYLGDIKNDYEINFILNNYNDITKNLTLEELKENALKIDSNIQKLLNLLNLPEEFIKQNYSNIKEFCTKGLAEIAIQYYENDKLGDLQRNNLLLIVKAVLAGKLKELKYGSIELEKELSINSIDENIKTKWITNTSLKYKGVSVKEFDDFESTMKIGEIPIHTCMSWINGTYSECLLSNFDSNKKIINTINGKTVGTRAILRFTKIKSNHSEKSLAFIDITKEEENELLSNENIGLFLEKPYDKSLNEDMLNIHLAAIVELAKEKAKEMGVELIVSTYYKEVMKGYNESEKYIFISRSKNGKQYLDSLSGTVTVSDEGKYRKASKVYEINNI